MLCLLVVCLMHRLVRYNLIVRYAYKFEMGARLSFTVKAVLSPLTKSAEPSIRCSDSTVSRIALSSQDLGTASYRSDSS